MIKTDYVKSFREIFDTLPKTVMAADLDINNNRFSYLMRHVDEFTLGSIFAMASLLEVDEQTFINLIMQQRKIDKLERKCQAFNGSSH